MKHEIVFKDKKFYIALLLSRDINQDKPIYLIEFNLVNECDFKFLPLILKEVDKDELPD